MRVPLEERFRFKKKMGLSKFTNLFNYSKNHQKLFEKFQSKYVEMGVMSYKTASKSAFNALKLHVKTDNFYFTNFQQMKNSIDNIIAPFHSVAHSQIPQFQVEDSNYIPIYKRACEVMQTAPKTQEYQLVLEMCLKLTNEPYFNLI